MIWPSTTGTKGVLVLVNELYSLSFGEVWGSTGACHVGCWTLAVDGLVSIARKDLRKSDLDIHKKSWR